MGLAVMRLGALTGAAIAALAFGGCAEQVRGLEKSMEPTIRSGEILRLDTHAYDHRPPARGEIVALRAPSGAEQERCGVQPRLGQPCPRPTGPGDLPVVKRVVALAGDRVAIDRFGRLLLNGTPQHENYIRRCAPSDSCALPRAIRIPPGDVFVLGDNRPNSSDSRYWGPVPVSWIEGRITPPRGRRHAAAER
jgi:signal peptidase I